MNGPQDNATLPDGEAQTPPSEDAAPAKPARRKRAMKAAPAEAGEGVAAEAVAPTSEEGAAKPVRKRRAPAKKADDAAGAAEAAPEAPAAAAAAAESPPVSPQAPLPFEPVPGGHAAEIATPATTGEDAPDAGEPASSEGSAAPGAEAGAGGERSRRRNRRERRRGRGERAAAGEEAAGADAGEAADTEDDAAADEAPALVIPAEAGELFAQVISGEYDAAVEPAPEEPAAPPKRVLRPEPEAPKLHKVLAQAGIGSRRDMEQMILDGEISVNGQPAHIGQRISFGDHIKVNGKPVKVRILPPPPRVIAYHKPAGEVVTHDDPQHRPTVFRRLPRLQQGKWQSVGRLDLNTEGLLLFTNSGELANQLMHPRFGVEREYAVRVLGTLDEEARAQLLEGVSIDGQAASFRSIQDGGGEGANHWYRVVITEGRNREVRKLFDAVGLTVSRLIRIRYGSVVLPLGLKRGVWADLSDADVRVIRQLAGGAGGREARDEPRNERGGRNKRRGDRNNSGNNGGNARGPKQRGFDQPPRQNVDRDRGQDHDHDEDDDFDPARIPNPLEQTFDKRFVQNPRSPAGGRGFRQGGGGFGAGGSAPDRPKKGGGPREPDPLQTSLGYLGADAYRRNKGRSGGGGGGGRGGNRGGGGGFGGGGRRGR